MDANAMTPNWAIEKATPVDLAMTPVAAAVPGPQTTRAAVPRNSAATFRESDASALDAICRPARSRDAATAGPQLLQRGPKTDTLFGSAKQSSAESPSSWPRCQWALRPRCHCLIGFAPAAP